MRRLIVVLAVALAVWAGAASTADRSFRTVTLFEGGDTDSTEQASNWVDIKGARRIYVRTWSSHAVFAIDGADSAYSDSLITFNVLVSDSVSFMARDSLGTLVTAKSDIPFVRTAHGPIYPVCADSLVLPVTVAGDTAKSFIGSGSLPINKALRAPSNGSGLVTVIFPARPGPGTAGQMDESGIISKNYMRIRCIPLRRLTGTGSASTQGIRVNGLKGFKMTATIFYD